MYSPVSSTLRGKDLSAAVTQQQTTCQIDADVAAQASKSLLDAFNQDPLHAVEEEVMVAIGTPVLDVDPDNPYHVTCSVDVAFIRIDTTNLTEDCKQVTCCCEIRPISGEFRIHPIGNTHALVDTRNTNHLLQPWALCSRNADLTLRYYSARTNTPFVYKPVNCIYAPLPELVEDYVINTLHRTVLDGRAVIGAITTNAAPDVLPFELSLDDYLTAQHDFEVFTTHITALRDSAVHNNTSHTICWDHYSCGDNTTYVDVDNDEDTSNINATLTLPAELIAAAASTSTAKELARRLFGTRATKNVVRAVGGAPSLGTLACAMALITDDTPSDWIAGIISHVNNYSAATRTQYTLDHDPATSMAPSLALMQPYITALDTHSYMRMLKPLSTGKLSFAEQLLDCSGGDCSDLDNPYSYAPAAYCAVTTARPTSLHYNQVICDIDTATTRTLGDYIRSCGTAVSDIQNSLDSGLGADSLSVTAFLRWAGSPAGQQWQNSHDDAEAYFAKVLNACVYKQLVERIDGMVISDIGVRLHVATSTAEYITLGNTLSNCIKDYTYQPQERSIIAVYEDDRPSKPVAAMEITPHTRTDSMINQFYAKANSLYRYDDRVRTLVNIETSALRTELNNATELNNTELNK